MTNKKVRHTLVFAFSTLLATAILLLIAAITLDAYFAKVVITSGFSQGIAATDAMSLQAYLNLDVDSAPRRTAGLDVLR